MALRHRHDAAVHAGAGPRGKAAPRVGSEKARWADTQNRRAIWVEASGPKKHAAMPARNPPAGLLVFRLGIKEHGAHRMGTRQAHGSQFLPVYHVKETQPAGAAGGQCAPVGMQDGIPDCFATLRVATAKSAQFPAIRQPRQAYPVALEADAD